MSTAPGDAQRIEQVATAVIEREPFVKYEARNGDWDIVFKVPRTGEPAMEVWVVGAGLPDGSAIAWWVERALARIARARIEGR